MKHDAFLHFHCPVESARRNLQSAQDRVLRSADTIKEADVIRQTAMIAIAQSEQRARQLKWAEQ